MIVVLELLLMMLTMMLLLMLLLMIMMMMMLMTMVMVVMMLTMMIVIVMVVWTRVASAPILLGGHLACPPARTCSLVAVRAGVGWKINIFRVLMLQGVGGSGRVFPPRPLFPAPTHLSPSPQPTVNPHSPGEGCNPLALDRRPDKK